MRMRASPITPDKQLRVASAGTISAFARPTPPALTIPSQPLQTCPFRTDRPLVLLAAWWRRRSVACRCFHKTLNRLFAREDTHKIAIGDRDLINDRFGPLCGLKSDISRGPRSANSGRCRHSRNETLWNASLGLLRLDPRELHDLAPLFRFIRDHFSEISRRHRCWHDAKLAETRFHLGIG